MAYEYELLPPIVPDMLPAFGSAQSTVKFYFSIGNQEELIKEHINTIQVSIQQQSQSTEMDTGNIRYTFFEVKSIFINTSSSIAPCAGVETKNTNLGDHFIQLNNDNSLFPCDKFFRIQIRFSKKNYSSLNNVSLDSSDFSEWSKICLVKKIKQPILQIKQPFQDDKNDSKSKINQISFIPYRIMGQLQEGSETLKTVNISIIDLNTKKMFLQSGDFIPNEAKKFIYILKKQPLQGRSYKLKIQFTTQSGYIGTIIRTFISISQGDNNNPILIETIPIPNQGKIQIQLSSENENDYYGNFVIRRSSSETNFTQWEDIQIVQLNCSNESNNLFIWEDYTIKCGIYYKYGIAPLKSNGWRGKFKTSGMVACFFDDMFLMGDNRQLRIKFDPTISNFKYNVNENLQTTLGSKYPFIKRNGKNYYRSFTIGGLITTYMDTETNALIYNDSLRASDEQDNIEIKDFSSKEELFNKGINDDPSPLSKINEYNKAHNIDQYEDVIYEREFRQAVLDFLYKNSIKLFRSNTQGNMLIKLMNINLTPKENLGRLLYSFSADAIEIDDCNIQNYDKYNIQKINSYEAILNKRTITGQIMESINTASLENIELLNLIIQKYKNNNQYGTYIPDKDIASWKKSIRQIDVKSLISLLPIYIKYLKVEIYSLPGLIDIENNNTYSYTTNTKNNNSTILGYLLQVKNKNGESGNIIVKSFLQQKRHNFDTKGFQSLQRQNNKQFFMGTYIFNNLEDIENISIISPPNNKEIIINLQYIIDVNTEYYDKIPIQQKFYLYPGQLQGTFEPNTDIIKTIKNNYLHYYFKNESNLTVDNLLFTQKKISGIYKLSLETPIDAVVEIQTSNFNNSNDNNDNNNHILNMGYLNISDFFANNSSQGSIDIEKCIFKGLHFSPCSAEKIKGNKKYSPSSIKEDYKYPRKNEYISVDNPNNLNDGTFNSIEDISKEDLIQNGVYSFSSVPYVDGTIQSNALITPFENIYNNSAIIDINENPIKYIYLNNKWYLFDDNLKIAQCPVDAIINYVYEGGKVTYKLVKS